MGNCCTTDTTIPDELRQRNTEESRSADQLQQPLMKGTGGERAEVQPNRSNSVSSSLSKKKKKKKHKKGVVELQKPTILQHIMQMSTPELTEVWNEIDVDNVNEINIEAELEKLFMTLIEHYVRDVTGKTTLESKYNHRIQLLSKELRESFETILQNYQYKEGDYMTKHFFLTHLQQYIATPNPVYTLIATEHMRPRDSYVVIDSGDDQDAIPVIPPSSYRSEDHHIDPHQMNQHQMDQHHTMTPTVPTVPTVPAVPTQHREQYEIHTIHETADHEQIEKQNREQDRVHFNKEEEEHQQNADQLDLMNVPSDSMKAERCASPMASESSKYVHDNDDETDTLTITTNPEAHPADHYEHGGMMPATSEQSQVTNLTGITRGTSTLTVQSTLTAGGPPSVVGKESGNPNPNPNGNSNTNSNGNPNGNSNGVPSDKHTNELSMFVNVGSTIGQPDTLESPSDHGTAPLDHHDRDHEDNDDEKQSRSNVMIVDDDNHENVPKVIGNNNMEPTADIMGDTVPLPDEKAANTVKSVNAVVTIESVQNGDGGVQSVQNENVADIVVDEQKEVQNDTKHKELVQENGNNKRNKTDKNPVVESGDIEEAAEPKEPKKEDTVHVDEPAEPVEPVNPVEPVVSVPVTEDVNGDENINENDHGGDEKEETVDEVAVESTEIKPTDPTKPTEPTETVTQIVTQNVEQKEEAEKVVVTEQSETIKEMNNESEITKDMKDTNAMVPSPEKKEEEILEEESVVIDEAQQTENGQNLSDDEYKNVADEETQSEKDDTSKTQKNVVNAESTKTENVTKSDDVAIVTNTEETAGSEESITEKEQNKSNGGNIVDEAKEENGVNEMNAINADVDDKPADDVVDNTVLDTVQEEKQKENIKDTKIVEDKGNMESGTAEAVHVSG